MNAHEGTKGITFAVYCILVNWNYGLVGVYVPEEVESFVFEHQAVVACQIQLLQSGRKRVRQLDLRQLIAAQIHKLESFKHSSRCRKNITINTMMEQRKPGTF